MARLVALLGEATELQEAGRLTEAAAAAQAALPLAREALNHGQPQPDDADLPAAAGQVAYMLVRYVLPFLVLLVCGGRSSAWPDVLHLLTASCFCLWWYLNGV